jgi:hypothetical protein
LFRQENEIKAIFADQTIPSDIRENYMESQHFIEV